MSWLKLLTLTTIILALSVNTSFPEDAKSTGQQKVDAGGLYLDMLVLGSGTPTIVFEAGLGGRQSWSTVPTDVAKFAKVVAYDRAGFGQSEPSSKPRTARQIATELHTALQNAMLPPPYVLVGHSVGGLYVRVFADMFPQDVAGLVLVDPQPDGLGAWLEAHRPGALKAMKEGAAQAPEGFRGEIAAMETSARQAGESSLPRVPVVLLTAMRQEPPMRDQEMLDAWLAMHTEWVKRVPSSRQIVTTTSGHNIQKEQPGLVIEAVGQVVDEVRSKSGGI